jgi:hypothetical protein
MKNLDFYLLSIDQDAHAWHSFSEEAKSDPKIFIHAFLRDFSIFKDASIKIKENHDLVAEILRIDGYSLQHCLPKDRQDYFLCLSAVNANPLAIKWVDPALLDVRRDLVLSATSRRGSVLVVRKDCIPEKWYGDFGIMDTAMETCPWVFGIASAEYRGDKSRAYNAVSKLPINYRDVSDQLKLDPDLATIAIQKSNFLWKYIPVELLNNVRFIDNIRNTCPELILNINSILSSNLDMVG